MSVGLARAEARTILGTREQFAAGSSTLTGIRPLIALSWLRCRDDYAVDPGLTFAPRASTEVADVEGKDTAVVTWLSRLAAIIHEQLNSNVVVTVVDSDGRLVHSWGHGVPGALEANLAPQYSWSEATAGTNGMGTALCTDRVTAIRGPEHWCDGFQSLDCLGTAIQDPVTRSSAGAINVSSPTGRMPKLAYPLLDASALRVTKRLHERARAHGHALLDAYRSAPPRHAPRVAVDAGGNVVVATRAAAVLLDIPYGGPWIDPGDRVRLPVRGLDDLMATALSWAGHSEGWMGSGKLDLPDHGEPVETTFAGVLSDGDTIGFVLSFGTGGGEPIGFETWTEPKEISWVVAEQPNHRTLLLNPSEIRCARANGNSVLLDTDRGLLRAAERGLTALEERLRAHGFLRVHRGFLVNSRRVREVGRGDRNDLLLFMDGAPATPVPVSRARAKHVRARLGL